MRKVPRLRDYVRACPKCESQSMTVTLLTYYNVSMRCSDCLHRWTISHEDVAAVSLDGRPAMRSAADER
jgi:hypothetical protein